MALPEISTGYKPEFGLGALYQGFNAGNADQSAQEEIIKQFLANQRSQQMNPLDVTRLQQQITMDKYKESPEYQQYMSDTQRGQSKSSLYAGLKAEALSPQEIANAKQKLSHEDAVGQLISRLDELKSTGQSGNGIGFNMQPVSAQPTSGFNWQVPQNVQQSRDRDSLGIMQQEQLQYPNDPALATDIANRKASLAQGINENNSPLVPQPPKRQGGISPGGSEYEQVMQALIDIPELRAALVKGDQKLDSAEFNAMLKLIGQREIAAAKTAAKGPEKLSAEQAAVRRIMQQVDSKEITPEQGDLAMWDLFNRKTAKPEQAGVTGQVDANGDIGLQNKPNVPMATPPSKKAVQQSDADLINKYLK